MKNIQNNLPMIKVDWIDEKNNIIFNVIDCFVKDGIVKIEFINFDNEKYELYNINKNIKSNIQTLILDLRNISGISILNNDLTEGEIIYKNNYNYIFDSEIWNNIKKQ